MRFSVCHRTRYRYSTPVEFATHTLRLTPRADGTRLLSRTLTIEPLPTMRGEGTDAFGNAITTVAFEGVSDSLSIESRFALETRLDPEPPIVGLPPLPWPVDTGDGLAAYRSPAGIDDSVRDFAAALAADANRDPHAFLDRLNRTLFARTDRHVRETGAARTPAETLASAKGACRDLAVLFMAACRSLGLAARFVSGYQAHAESVDGRRHLHAWPEVFLPGVGWRGYDPTHGLAVRDGHVALCAAPHQAATMPVEGGYFGAGVTSSLDYEIRIETAP